MEILEKLMFNFEKLESWHRGVDLADLVCSSIREFPRDEMFGLPLQIRRAAVSLSSTFAEGTSRSSRADFARFAEIAAGSLFELVSQSVIAKHQGFLSESDYLRPYQDAEKLGKMLSGLRIRCFRDDHEVYQP
jgi:four helix bundle protein